MKKAYLIVLFFVFTHSLLFAQLAQGISGVIKYRTKLIQNEVDKYNLASYLYFNTQTSLFVYDRKQDMEAKDSLEYNPKTNDEQNSSLAPKSRKRDEYGRMYFKDNQNQTLKIREFILGKPYITTEKTPTIKWVILSEHKKIGKFTCQKAIAPFRGRTYEVWFCSAIPLNIGPWKLQGLPGAILEAHSTDGIVVFELEKAEIPKDVQNQLTFTALPSGEIVTFEEFKKTPEKETKKRDTDFLEYIKAEFEKAGIKHGEMTQTSTTPLPFSIELNYE